MLVTIFSYKKVHARNVDWKNNKALYFADIEKSPNSVRLLAFCGMTLVPESDKILDSISKVKNIKLALNYFRRAYSIYPKYVPMYQDWGGAYFRLNNIDSAEWTWNQLKKLKPNSKFIPLNDDLIAKFRYNALCIEFQQELPNNNILKLLAIQKKAISYFDKAPDSWAVLGKLFMLDHKNDSAAWAFKKCLVLDPSNSEAQEYLPQLLNRKK